MSVCLPFPIITHPLSCSNCSFVGIYSNKPHFVGIYSNNDVDHRPVIHRARPNFSMYFGYLHDPSLRHTFSGPEQKSSRELRSLTSSPTIPQCGPGPVRPKSLEIETNRIQDKKPPNSGQLEHGLKNYRRVHFEPRVRSRTTRSNQA